jgi:hypothetical protein
MFLPEVPVQETQVRAVSSGSQATSAGSMARPWEMIWWWCAVMADALGFSGCLRRPARQCAAPDHRPSADRAVAVADVARAEVRVLPARAIFRVTVASGSGDRIRLMWVPPSEELLTSTGPAGLPVSQWCRASAADTSAPAPTGSPRVSFGCRIGDICGAGQLGDGVVFGAVDRRQAGGGGPDRRQIGRVEPGRGERGAHGAFDAGPAGIPPADPGRVAGDAVAGELAEDACAARAGGAAAFQDERDAALGQQVATPGPGP